MAPLKVVRFDATTLWHLDAAEWAPSTASFTSFPPSRRVRFALRADIRPMPAFMSPVRSARSKTFRFFRLWLWLGCCAARQPHRKDRALARLARHGHVAPHHARELARDGKPEPRPTVAARRK